MNRNNNKNRIQTLILKKAAEEFMEGTLPDVIDRIPVVLFPKNSEPYRCCVYKDRAVARYRLMALLGFRVEDETDEARPLRDYFREAFEPGFNRTGVLSIIDIACSSCPSNKVEVTDKCRGCLARPCQSTCPKDAIQIRDGRARIDDDLCIHCGKCVKVCPFEAITVHTAPCEQSCPVKALERTGSGPVKYDSEKCILCGNCCTACPFGAVVKVSSVFQVLKAVEAGRDIIAMVAPSAAGQFPGSVGQCLSAVKTLGFTDAVEVALGAEETITSEAAELKKHAEQGDGPMTSSCCPAFVRYIKKKVPEMVPRISKTPSPMIFTARKVRESHPEALTVFIGPCIAKNGEAEESEEVDYVMTFDELGALFMAAKIRVEDQPEYEPEWLCRSSDAKGFAAAGGVAAALKKVLPDLEYAQVNCITRKSTGVLKSFLSGGCPADFIEGMSCEGGCLNGPGVIADPRISTGKLDQYRKSG